MKLKNNNEVEPISITDLIVGGLDNPSKRSSRTDENFKRRIDSQTRGLSLQGPDRIALAYMAAKDKLRVVWPLVNSFNENHGELKRRHGLSDFELTMLVRAQKVAKIIMRGERKAHEAIAKGTLSFLLVYAWAMVLPRITREGSLIFDKLVARGIDDLDHRSAHPFLDNLSTKTGVNKAATRAIYQLVRFLRDIGRRDLISGETSLAVAYQEALRLARESVVADPPLTPNALRARGNERAD